MLCFVCAKKARKVVCGACGVWCVWGVRGAWCAGVWCVEIQDHRTREQIELEALIERSANQRESGLEPPVALVFYGGRLCCLVRLKIEGDKLWSSI